MRDGKLLAIPIGFRSNQMFYNAGKLAEIGLTTADMPATLPELCQFITRWNREWMNDPAKANVMPLCTMLPNRQVVLELMLESYRGYYDATGQPLNFDTPLFHELLTALEAMDAFTEAGILFVPSKAANAGGVAVSALEMSQNSERLVWTAEEVDQQLKGIMKNIHKVSVEAAEEYGLGYNLVAGANIAGFKKVATAMMEQGVF